MTRQKILILTSAHLCRNPRVVKEATTLGAAGHEVTVLSLSVNTRCEQMDLELMRGLPFKRLTLDYCAGNLQSRAAGFLQRASTWAARRLCRQVGIETAQALGPASALLRRARSFATDLTIVHTEIPLWAATQLIADGRRVAVDMEDWYAEDLLPADRSSRPLRLLRRAEEAALRRAVYSTATAQSMADALTTAYQCPPPIVIRNSFPLQARSRIDRPATIGVPEIIWFSQTIGPGRGLEQFLAAWALTRQPSRLTLLGEARAAYAEQLAALLPPSRRPDLVILPPVQPAELPLKLAEFDLGLALEARTPPSRDVTITNKILQYLNAGLALVATDTAGQREVMAAAPACGVLLPSATPAQVAGLLDALLADRNRLRSMQVAARAAAEREFCWEQEAPRLLAAVQRALASPLPLRR